MEITRSFKLSLSSMERQAVKSITNQSSTIDAEIFGELIDYINKKLSEAFDQGYEEALENRARERTETASR